VASEPGAGARNDVRGGGRYLSLGQTEREEMLEVAQASSIDELFEPIPESVRFSGLLDLQPQMAEQELLGHLQELSSRSAPEQNTVAFLGAGCNPHYVPTHVDALIQRQEFLTAYTPYQAEVGQGTLQAIFEFQSLVCMLTGMEVCNASVYDGASSVAEAVLMARRLTRRPGKVLYSAGLHPNYLEVTRTYATYLDIEFEEMPVGDDGRTVIPEIGDDVIAVVLQQPSFFGVIEDLRSAGSRIADTAAKFIVATAEPLGLALTTPPGEVGADIVVGELQSFGNGMNFGGPLVGFMACRDRDKRNLPGRLAGETFDADGKRGYVLTLSTREQHIRRAKATSNICTNEALCALAACIHMCSLGRHGLADLARHNLAKASYARDALVAVGATLVYSAPMFNEFVIDIGRDAAAVVGACADKGIIPGVALGRFDSRRATQLLVCATEVHSRAQIDRLAAVVAEVTA